MSGKVLKFPEGFLWGSATSAYQVEGGIENNNWWAWAYKKEPVSILGREISLVKAGKACDHYNLYEKDFDLAKSLFQNAHRFSIEWARIEPEEGKFNIEALEHYRSVIRSLKERQIIPFVTLHHFTNPVWFHKKGNWLKPDSIESFGRYVEFIAKNLGEEAEFWMTVNEPELYASWYPPLQGAYKGSRLPDPIDALRVINNLIQAHKKAYGILHRFGGKNIKVGVAKNNFCFDGYPDIFAKIASWFWNREFLNRIKNHQDFIGLNYYFHNRFKISPIRSPKKWFNQNENKETTDMGWEIYPEGIYYVLRELKRYNLPVYITENGLADKGDQKREKFIRDHLFWIKKAIDDGVDVRGYFYWSLMDNFEWDKGFDPRFGLLEMDYKTMQRKIRPSANFYADICKNNQIIID